MLTLEEAAEAQKKKDHPQEEEKMRREDDPFNPCDVNYHLYDSDDHSASASQTNAQKLHENGKKQFGSNGNFNTAQARQQPGILYNDPEPVKQEEEEIKMSAVDLNPFDASYGDLTSHNNVAS